MENEIVYSSQLFVCNVIHTRTCSFRTCPFAGGSIFTLKSIPTVGSNLPRHLPSANLMDKQVLPTPTAKSEEDTGRAEAILAWLKLVEDRVDREAEEAARRRRQQPTAGTKQE
jgi:hypothetical protein